jgi:hypothetical protein
MLLILSYKYFFNKENLKVQTDQRSINQKQLLRSGN